VGHVMVGKRACVADDLARLTGESTVGVSALLAELEQSGVFSRTGKGIIYSRRMVRDEKRAKISAENGKLGGNPSLSKRAAISNQDNLDFPGGVKPHIPESRIQNPELEKVVVGAREQDAFGRIYAALETAMNRTAFSGGRIHAWLRDGADVELDILPTIAMVGAEATRRGGIIRSPTYFDAAIVDAKTMRTKPLPAAGANGAAAQPEHPIYAALDRMNAAIDERVDRARKLKPKEIDHE
ncbi:MAG: hypothetical protein ACREDG_03375, partial [Methylocella sp.]